MVRTGLSKLTQTVIVMIAFLISFIFMPPPYQRCRRHYVSGLSVRLSGCPSGLIRLRDNSSITWWNFIKAWYRGALPGVDELIIIVGEIRPTSRFKGQRIWSKYAIFPSLTRNLKNPWVDFHQTWYRGVPPGVDELIRFWARSVQRQRSKVNEHGLNMLFSPR